MSVVHPGNRVLVAALALVAGCEFSFSVGNPPPHEHDVPGPTRAEPLVKKREPPAEQGALRAAEPRSAQGLRTADPPEAAPAVPDAAPVPAVPAAPTGPAVLFVYRVDRETVDPFGEAELPKGVQIMERRGNARSMEGLGGPYDQRVARVYATDDETLAEAIARVRPWFAALEVPEGRRWFFEMPRDRDGKPVTDSDAVLTVGDPVEIHTTDIAHARFDDGHASRIEIEFTPAATERIAAETTPLVDDTIAIVVDDHVLWSPKLGGPYAGPGLSTLVFTDDPTFAQRVIDTLRPAG